MALSNSLVTLLLLAFEEPSPPCRSFLDWKE